MPEIRNSLLRKSTLWQFDLPLISVKNFEHLFNMLQVFFIISAIDENIVKEYESKLAED
jgi:hypothetical protein